MVLAYKRYAELCREECVFDFDDLLFAAGCSCSVMTKPCDRSTKTGSRIS